MKLSYLDTITLPRGGHRGRQPSAVVQSAREELGYVSKMQAKPQIREESGHRRRASEAGAGPSQTAGPVSECPLPSPVSPAPGCGPDVSDMPAAGRRVNLGAAGAEERPQAPFPSEGDGSRCVPATSPGRVGDVHRTAGVCLTGAYACFPTDRREERGWSRMHDGSEGRLGCGGTVFAVGRNGEDVRGGGTTCLRMQRASITAPGPINPGQQLHDSLAEACAQFVLDRRASNVRPATLRFYEQQLLPFLAWCSDTGAEGIERVAPAHVRSYIAQRCEQGLADASLVSAYRALHASFSFWVGEELIDRSPMDNVTKPRCEQRIPQALDRAGVKRLLRACRQALTLVLVDAGCWASSLPATAECDFDPGVKWGHTLRTAVREDCRKMLNTAMRFFPLGSSGRLNALLPAMQARAMPTGACTFCQYSLFHVHRWEALTIGRRESRSRTAAARQIRRHLRVPYAVVKLGALAAKGGFRATQASGYVYPSGVLYA